VSALLQLDPVPLPDGLSIPAEDGRETPINVRHQVLSLLKQVEALAARLHRDSSNASRPPSTDSLLKKRQRRVQASERRKPGAKPGHPGHHQGLLEPTASVSLLPDPCVCGHRRLADVTLSHTHQVIE
jgi:transposase